MRCLLLPSPSPSERRRYCVARRPLSRCVCVRHISLDGEAAGAEALKSGTVDARRGGRVCGLEGLAPSIPTYGVPECHSRKIF